MTTSVKTCDVVPNQNMEQLERCAKYLESTSYHRALYQPTEHCRLNLFGDIFRFLLQGHYYFHRPALTRLNLLRRALPAL